MTKLEVIIIIIAFGFNCLDWITGFINALKDNKVSSKKMREGLFHKLAFICCYVLGVLLNIANTRLHLDIPVNMVYVICTYVVLTETISILENIHKINPLINTDDFKKHLK